MIECKVGNVCFSLEIATLIYLGCARTRVDNGLHGLIVITIYAQFMGIVRRKSSTKTGCRPYVGQSAMWTPNSIDAQSISAFFECRRFQKLGGLIVTWPVFGVTIIARWVWVRFEFKSTPEHIAIYCHEGIECKMRISN